MLFFKKEKENKTRKGVPKGEDQKVSVTWLIEISCWTRFGMFTVVGNGWLFSIQVQTLLLKSDSWERREAELKFTTQR